MRYLIALPATLLGLALAVCAGRVGDRLQVRSGVLEVCGPGVRRIADELAPNGWRVRAFTLGHVVFARDALELERNRRHERVHVEQYERWGAALLPAYVIAAVAAGLAGGEPYFDGAFERAARKPR